MPEGTPNKKTQPRRKAPSRRKGSPEAERKVVAVVPPSEAAKESIPVWASTLAQQMGDIAGLVGTMTERLDAQQGQIESLRSGQQQQQQAQQPSAIIDPTTMQPAVPTDRDLAARSHLNAAGINEAEDVSAGFSDNPNIRAAADQYAHPVNEETSVDPEDAYTPPGEKRHETRHLRRPEAFHPPMGMTDPSRHVKPTQGETGESVKAAMDAAPQTVAIVPVKTVDKIRVGKAWYQLIQGRKMRVPVDVARHLAEKHLIWTGG